MMRQRGHDGGCSTCGHIPASLIVPKGSQSLVLDACIEHILTRLCDDEHCLVACVFACTYVCLYSCVFVFFLTVTVYVLVCRPGLCACWRVHGLDSTMRYARDCCLVLFDLHPCPLPELHRPASESGRSHVHKLDLGAKRSTEVSLSCLGQQLFPQTSLSLFDRGHSALEPEASARDSNQVLPPCFS